jgi:hypothetical protein
LYIQWPSFHNLCSTSIKFHFNSNISKQLSILFERFQNKTFIFPEIIYQILLSVLRPRQNQLYTCSDREPPSPPQKKNKKKHPSFFGFKHFNLWICLLSYLLLQKYFVPLFSEVSFFSFDGLRMHTLFWDANKESKLNDIIYGSNRDKFSEYYFVDKNKII